MRQIVYDIETICNCFTCCCIDVKTGIIQRFVVCAWRNDYEEFLDYLEDVELMIGFNNIGFDWAVLYPFITESEKYRKMRGFTLAKTIYKRSQQVIEEAKDRTPGKKKMWIEQTIPQLDLYRIWHFNNKARSTSLKWLQVCMHFPNVQEMEHKHDEELKPWQLKELLQYNVNDIMSTLQFYKLSQDKIKMREELTVVYGRSMTNYPDTKIGEAVFMLGLSKKLHMTEKDIKYLGGTHRQKIVVADFIPELQFESKEFKRIYDNFREMTITETKRKKTAKEKKRDKVLFSCVFDGMQYDFGFGGLHGLRASGIYQNLLSADVKSYYPNLSIGQKMYPAHLGEEFCEVYKELYDERAKLGKKDPKNGALKLALNGTFGASNAAWSPFYDPQFTMSITIWGQLLLAKLCEDITLNKAGRIIMANTDGIELEVYNQVTLDCLFGRWQREWNLILEFAKYKKIAIANVNNYIGVFDDGSVKEKGAFETAPEIYKSQSMLIVPIAVRDYFVDGVPIEKTINECMDLKKFILGNRAKTGTLRWRAIDKKGQLVNAGLPKNLRYYISHTGGSIVKVTKKKNSDKEKITKLHDGRVMTLFNVWKDKPFEEYGVYKPFYINEANRLMNSAIQAQTTLF